MVVRNWILPILIGIVAAIALISILYNNPRVKAYFTDVGNMLNLDISKLDSHTTRIWRPIENICTQKELNNSLKKNNSIIITNVDSPVYNGEYKGQPIYNYFPKIPVV